MVTSFVESARAPMPSACCADMANQGNKMIFGTTFGYARPMLQVAADNPEVKFRHATGYKTALNMRTCDEAAPTGSAYMASAIAGKMTKTSLRSRGRLHPDSRSSATSTASLGAQSGQRRSRPKVVWSQRWFQPQKPKPPPPSSTAPTS